MAHTRINRRGMLTGAAGAVGVVGALAVLQNPTSASAAGSAGTGDDVWGLEGTWLSTVALASRAPFQSLSTYAGGGGLVTTAQTQVRGAPSRPGPISSHHGTWSRTGELTFQRHATAFTFDPTGAPTGTHTTDQRIMMAADGQSYSAQGTVTVADLTGKVLLSSGAGTEQATRMGTHGMHATGSTAGQ